MLTTEQAQKGVDAERAELANRALAGQNTRSLAIAVNAVAAAEGRHFVIAHIENMRGKGVEDAKIYDHLSEYVLNGPDDTWSGRTNDVRRSHYDGMIGEIRNFRYSF